MTAPISGPFTWSEVKRVPQNGYMPEQVFRSRTWYRQRRPYNLPLNYTYRESRVVSSNKTEGYTIYAWSPYVSLDNDPSKRAAAYNAAYAKFKGALGENAQLGITLGERKQAMDMMTSRIVQIGSFANRLRKLDFVGAAKALNLTPQQVPKGLRRKSKAFANNYLEFHFGWSPLVSDIGNAVAVLQGGIPPVRVIGRGKVTSKEKRYWSPQPPGQGNISGFEWHAMDYVTQCKIAADIQVTNPNLWLANQLGFVNPATVAWELVPYSFVVDWFVNVSDFLSGYTDFLGLSITRGSTTFARNCSSSHTYGAYNSYYRKWIVYEERWKDCEIIRTGGIGSGPSLRVKQPWVLSPRRGLAAISLLIQKLR